MASSDAHPAAGPRAERPAGASHETRPGDIAIGVIIGRISEFFDFFVFGLACVLVFPETFFPFSSQLQGTFYAFAIFSLAFIGRPFGSMFFMLLQAWYGRGTKLTVALFMLGTTTAGIAFVPAYASIGSAAIIILALLRFLQGVATGGSWDGLPSLLALTAPSSRRGWFAMIPQLSAPIGFVMAAGLFAYLQMGLSSSEFLDWGWRYPFYVAFAMNVVALFARLRLVVAPEFASLMKTRSLEPSPIRELFRTQGHNIALGTFAPLGSYALFHLVTIFALSWAILYNGEFGAHFLLIEILGAALSVPAMFLSGVIADRFGRRLTLAISAVLIAVYSGYTPLLLSGGQFESYVFIVVGFALLGFSHAQSAGAVSSAFQPQFRYSGAMITSDLGWLFGAGFAPIVALGLTAYLGVGYVGLYLLSGAVGTLGALWVSRRFGLPNDQ